MASIGQHTLGDASTRGNERASPRVASEQEILDAVSARLPSRQVSLRYRVGLGAVVVCMLLLPCVYVMLVAGVVYCTGWFAVNAAPLMNQGWFWPMFLYLGVLFAGAVACLFLFKPLFARRARAPAYLTLQPDNERLLHAFVVRLAGAVGAPCPSEIRVDMQVNASASLREGAFRVLTGELVLTIGLPLAAALDLRQFAGVLAHELGHFAQSGGMRSSYVIRTINLWLERVVHERDAWDLWLERAAQCDGPWSVLAIVNTTRALVWLSRLLLRGPMLLGQAVSCHLHRQMELDADRYEVDLVGAEGFVATTETMQLLSMTWHWAHEDLRRLLQEDLWVDDLPALVVGNLERVSPEQRQMRLQLGKAAKTRALDTHPSDADRIAAARRSRAPGSDHPQAAAACLFTDFSRLSQVLTRLYYRTLLEPTDPPGVLFRDPLETEGRCAAGSAR